MVNGRTVPGLITELQCWVLGCARNGAGLTKCNLNEGNMCLHFASRLEYRSLWVAQFDEAVKTSGYDLSGIGSPYDTKKRTADGTGAGGENNFAVGKHPAYAKEEQRKPTPFWWLQVLRDSLWLDKQKTATTHHTSSISMPLRPPTTHGVQKHNTQRKKNGLPVMREMPRNGP